MGFNWNSYLVFARQLRRLPNPTEVTRRTAISRAYYAMFHKAGLHASENGWPDYMRRGGTHSSLPQWYKNHIGDIDYQEVGEKLVTMRHHRELCDYEAVAPNLDANLDLVLSEAVDIEKILSRHQR